VPYQQLDKLGKQTAHVHIFERAIQMLLNEICNICFETFDSFSTLALRQSKK
jgi:hypothetical protein